MSALWEQNRFGRPLRPGTRRLARIEPAAPLSLGRFQDRTARSYGRKLIPSGASPLKYAAGFAAWKRRVMEKKNENRPNRRRTVSLWKSIHRDVLQVVT